MDFLRRLYRQLRDVWLGLSVPRRIALATIVVVSLLAIAAVTYYAVQPEWRVLFSGLAPEDAQAITSRLDTQGVPYRLAAGGSTILVHADQVNRLRLDFATEVTPGGKTKGYAIFDETNIGMTPFLQHVNLTRALQEELAKTIMQIEPVAFARVHLVLPEMTPFVREQKPPTASVMLRLKPGATLSRSTAAAITALVARSVEGLTPDHVTLVDAAGRVLSEPQTPEGGAGIADTQLEFRKRQEAYLSSAAERMLSDVLGPGKAVVRVSADINFKKLTTKIESFDNEKKALVKESSTTRKSTTGGGRTGGVAGVVSNVGSGRQPPTGVVGLGGGGSDNEETVDDTWQPTRTVEEVEEGRGMIERMTVAAVVDLSGGDGAKPVMNPTDVEAIIKQAVGFKTGRDTITVTTGKLATSVLTTQFDEEYQTQQKLQYYLALARNASLGVAAVIALLLGLLYLRRLRPRPTPPPPAPAPPPMPERERRVEEVANLAREDPEAVAAILLALLEERGPVPAS
jgi:flagellar M-ring protein FliF